MEYTVYAFSNYSLPCFVVFFYISASTLDYKFVKAGNVVYFRYLPNYHALNSILDKAYINIQIHFG